MNIETVFKQQTSLNIKEERKKEKVVKKKINKSKKI